MFTTVPKPFTEVVRTRDSGCFFGTGSNILSFCALLLRVVSAWTRCDGGKRWQANGSSSIFSCGKGTVSWGVVAGVAVGGIIQTPLAIREIRSMLWRNPKELMLKRRCRWRETKKNRRCTSFSLMVVIHNGWSAQLYEFMSLSFCKTHPKATTNVCMCACVFVWACRRLAEACACSPPTNVNDAQNIIISMFYEKLFTSQCRSRLHKDGFWWWFRKNPARQPKILLRQPRARSFPFAMSELHAARHLVKGGACGRII